MKFLIISAAILAMASCKPTDGHFVHVHQDTSGNYKATFNAGDIFKTEEGSNGEVMGTYTYVDGDGVTQKVTYTAGVGGFMPTGSNFPVAPMPEPENAEVVKAREEHLKAYNEILKTLPITDEFYQKSESLETPVAGFKFGSKATHLVPVVKYVPYEVSV